MKKCNVLLLMTDQQRWDTLGCYGNSVIETANLDWIASKGTVFTNAYSTSPACVPARASLITGMKPWNTGILGMGRGQGNKYDGFEHTLPGELAKAGYHTQGIGKMHFNPQRLLLGFHNTVLDESGRVIDPGFESDFKRWFDKNKTGDYSYTDHGISWNSWMARPNHAPEYLHPTNWTVNESIKFLKQRDPSKPFFLKTSFARPHSPYDAPSFYFDLYSNKELPEPYIGDWSHVNDVPKDAADPNAWRGVRSCEQIQRARAGYYGLIHHIDHQIGRLLGYLRKTKQLDNTLIIFTSDHGDMMGDHHLWRKTYAYEGSAHIPLIVCPPKGWNKVKSSVDEPVMLEDIMPTILDVAGMKVPATVDGMSMRSLMVGDAIDWREYVHGEHCTNYSASQEMQYITDGKYKYIWFPRTGKEQLFHLEVDPGECKNIAGENSYGEVLAKWRKKLTAELKPRNLELVEGESLVCQVDKGPIVSPKYMERMERAGYLEC